MRDIRYLVFGGGGPAGYAFAGALEELGQQPQFSFNNIQGVAGSSVGAIAALIVALNYSPSEASAKLAALDLKKLQDGGNFIHQTYRLFTKYGFYKGATLYEFILDILKDKTGRSDPENITFEDLKKIGCKPLYVVATKLFKENGIPTGKQKIFSCEKTPHTAVAATILASSAAPVYFARIRFKKINKGKYVLDPEGDLYNDGGILNNFPIDIFDAPQYMDLFNEPSNHINSHTLGLALRRTAQINDPQHKPKKEIIYDVHPVEYAEGLFNSLLLQYEQERLDKKVNRMRTVQIDRLGVKVNDFGIDEKTKQRLIDSGKQAVQAYFANPAPVFKSNNNIFNFFSQVQNNNVSSKSPKTHIYPEPVITRR